MLRRSLEKRKRFSNIFRITMHRSGYIYLQIGLQIGFPHVGPTLCGIVAAIVVAFAATPAHADDGVPAVPDATSIASTVAAAVDAIDVAPSVTVPTVTVPSPEADVPSAAATDPATTDAASNPVVLPTSASVPPAIPSAGTPPTLAADPAPTGPATPPAEATPPSPTQTAAASPSTSSSPTGAPTGAPAATQVDIPAAPVSPEPDTANTTPHNSDSITPITLSSSIVQPDSASQTFIWNWNWNCDANDTPTLPDLPPGATTIVWNWHWSCPAAPPPALDVAGVTICLSCNIAISVRLASPGDDGDLTQAIAAQAAATVTEVAAAVQQAAQVVPPPPAPVPVSVQAATSDPVEAFTSAPTVLQAQIDDGPAVPAESLGPDDVPRHGGQALLASWHLGRASAVPQRRSSVLDGWSVRGIQALRTSAPARASLVLVDLSRASSADPGHRSGGVAPATTRSLPPPVPAPSPDAPLGTLVAMSPVGPQQPAGSGVVALAIGGLGLFLLFFASSLVPLSRAVRVRAGVAEPHPPG